MRVKPSPRPHRPRVVLPRADLSIPLEITGWTGTLWLRIDRGYSETQRTPASSLKLFGQPPAWWRPKEWKVRRFVVYLRPEQMMKADHPADAVGSLMGDKDEWRAHVSTTPAEFTHISSAICAARALSVSLSVSKPRYRNAEVLSFSVEAASAPELLPPDTEDGY